MSALEIGTENWHQGDRLEQAVRRAGLDLAELDEIAENFGQDRLDMLLWRLRQHGLTER